MRRLIHYLFPIAALTLALMGSSRAQAPELAVCKDGSCVMNERDYRSLQNYVMSLREYATEARKNDEDRDNALSGALRALDSCKSRLSRNHA